MVIHGYIIPMRQRVGDLFDDETIAVIFSNLEQLYMFHKTFLQKLEEAGPDCELFSACFIFRSQDCYLLIFFYYLKVAPKHLLKTRLGLRFTPSIATTTREPAKN